MNDKTLVKKSFQILNTFLHNLGLVNNHPRQNEWVITKYKDAVVFQRKIAFRNNWHPVFMVRNFRVEVGDNTMSEKQIYETFNRYV